MCYCIFLCRFAIERPARHTVCANKVKRRPGLMRMPLDLPTWIGRQIRGSGDGDMARYENRVQEARLDERRRIARELHDRLGEVLTVGLRQLDLDEITGPQIPAGQ